jgi:[ribosomal protein S5]-alanine N-acetyltransferase
VTIERGEQLIQWLIRQAKEQPRTTFQLAITLGNGPVIGSCGIRIEPIADKQGSFGCELGHAYWRQGCVFEASRALVDFGFPPLGLHRIVAETLTEPTSAIQLAKKLELRVEGEFREHRYFRGRWWNTTGLAWIESEWQSISSDTGTEPAR